MRILIVEDDKVAQMIGKFVAQQLSFECDVAGTAQAAMDYADKTFYDLILMDIGLDNGNNGFDVTVNIRQTSKMNTTTPVLAVTAHIEEDYQERGREVGMLAVINKPLTVEKLQKYLGQLR